jgi:hypothetical protein
MANMRPERKVSKTSRKMVEQRLFVAVEEDVSLKYSHDASRL